MSPSSSSSSLLAVAALLLLAAPLPAALARGLAADSASAVADRVIAELDDFRALVPTGGAEFGIPVLEPLVVEQIPLDVKSSMLTASGSISDLTVKGISSFAVSSLQQTSGGSRSGRVSVAFTVPSASASTTYDLNGKLKVSFITVKLTGKSPVTATASGIKVSADIDLTINPDDSVTVDDLSNVNFSIDKVKVKVNSFSGVVNSLINKLIPQLIKSNRAKIAKLAEVEGKENLNKYFAIKAGKSPAVSVAAVARKLADDAAQGLIFSPLAQHLLERIALQLHRDQAIEA